MANFKTKDGKTVKFKSGSGRKKKSGLSAADRRKLSKAAKARPRHTRGKKKGQFK